MQHSRSIVLHFLRQVKFLSILLSRQIVAHFEDQVLVTQPQNLTRNKIKTFRQTIYFLRLAFFQFYLM